MYDIEYARPAEKYLKKIKDKSLRASYKTAFDEIQKDPYIGTQKVGDLRGIYGYDVMHGGINYEIAYRIYEENGQLIVVILAGTRENFYETLKRLVK